LNKAIKKRSLDDFLLPKTTIKVDNAVMINEYQAKYVILIHLLYRMNLNFQPIYKIHIQIAECNYPHLYVYEYVLTINP